MKILPNEIDRFLNDEDADFVPVQKIKKQRHEYQPPEEKKPLSGNAARSRAAVYDPFLIPDHRDGYDM